MQVRLYIYNQEFDLVLIKQASEKVQDISGLMAECREVVVFQCVPGGLNNDGPISVVSAGVSEEPTS